MSAFILGSAGPGNLHTGSQPSGIRFAYSVQVQLQVRDL